MNFRDWADPTEPLEAREHREDCNTVICTVPKTLHKCECNCAELDELDYEDSVDRAVDRERDRRD